MHILAIFLWTDLQMCIFFCNFAGKFVTSLTRQRDELLPLLMNGQAIIK